VIHEAGTLEMVFRPKNGGDAQKIKVYEFPESGGVAQTQYNTDDSIAASRTRVSSSH